LIDYLNKPSFVINIQYTVRFKQDSVTFYLPTVTIWHTF